VNTTHKIIGLVAAITLSPVGSFGAEVFPGATWEERTPEEVGLSENRLEDLADLVGGSGMIVRFGYKAYEWGSVTRSDNWASASKPVLSTLLFLADDQGLCSMDSAVGDFLSGGSDKDRSITFFDLANMISGYSRAEGPGEAWAYNDHAINLYGYVLCEEVFGGSPSTVFDDQLSFLQFEDPVSISNSKYGRIKDMSIRDFARLGLFWLNRGDWDGQQRIPESYFDLVTNQVPSGLPRTSADGSESWDLGTFGGPDNQADEGPGHYGMNFWVNTNGFFGDAPPDVYQANGHWGEEVCTVIPSMRVVAVGLGNWGHPSTEAIQLLLEADTATVSTGSTIESLSWGRVKQLYLESR
jgi:CubicO group peptidase (beta-lactamase class C family)